jgi:ATP-dependent exoDNAse (exonuclease V) alpha subunit
MSKHLSLRLPWHDRGWDGHVCDHPTANVYCSGEYGLKAHGIRDRKDDAEEEALSGRPCAGLGGYRPPCLLTIQTFGGPKRLPFVHEPKAFLENERFPVAPVEEPVDPYTAGTWPFDRVYRREEAQAGTPDVFVDRYSPDEAVQHISVFFDAFEPGRSLVFFYLNYDNPLNSERRRYVLVGAAEVDRVSSQREWQGMDPKISSVYGALVWNRMITHGYGAGRGARLPYQAYLAGGHDPSSILIEIPDEMSRHFKYVCRDFTDDEAAILLHLLLDALERGKAERRIAWDWDAQITWVNRALDRVWKDRGVFPGMGPVLEALGFPKATIYVHRHIAAKGVKDVRGHVLDCLVDPAKAESSEAVEGFKRVGRALRVLAEPTRKLLFDRLCLFELTTEQVKLIAGNGLVPESDRRKAGLVSSPSAILENPYLIVEEYDPAERDDRIPFHRVDHGVFLPKTRGDVAVPGLEAFMPDDRRRLRAAALRQVRSAGQHGHSFVLQDELLEGLSRLRLPGLAGTLGALTIAMELEFYEERLTVRNEGELTAWQERTTAEDEELIRDRLQKLRERSACKLPVVDWPNYLPKADARLPDATLSRARKEQELALTRLSRRPFSVLVGGAGTGKTSVIGALVKGLNAVAPGEKYVLLAPTGKAAVRLRRRIHDVAGVDLQPSTIHSYLMRGKWMDEESFRLQRDGVPIQDGATTVIVDECSMLDLPMLATILRALDWTRVRRLILVGDQQQLPPIGVGAPFRNIVDALFEAGGEGTSLSMLTVNCRQAQENSAALKLAEQFSTAGRAEQADELLDRVRLGGRIGPDLHISFFEDEHDFPEVLTNLLIEAVGELLRAQDLDPHFPPDRLYEGYDRLHRFDGDISSMRLDALEIISPFRGSYTGADAINTHVQRLLRGRLFDRAKKLGKAGGRRFVWPDKILQTQNIRFKAHQKIAWDGKANVDGYLANGELGRIMKLEWSKYDQQNIAWGRFETNLGLAIKIDGAWAERMLDLGYAMTVHKAQGSDFSGVVVVLPREERQHLMSRELLYTALTRFTQRLYLLIQGKPGDVDPLLRGLWLGSSDFLRRNTSLFGLRRAVPDLEDYRPEQRIHKTLREELVRSKSEALIANLLHASKVPYYYEKPLVAPDGSVRRPDFTIPVETPDGPDVRYWEHWGKLGDPGYDASVKRRRAWYQQHGFMDRLIETDEQGGFDSTRITHLIRSRILV